MPRDVGAERAAQQQLLREAERSIDAGVLAAIGGWLDVVRDALLQELGTPRRLAAAGTGDRTVPGGVANVDGAVNAAIQRSWGEWQNQLENSVLPTVSIAFGDAFQQIRRGDPQGAFNLQQQYLAEVSDRLKIWPQGAFEDIRPELIEALSDAATIDEMTERVGRVLNIDAKSRDLRARINDVEKRLADPDLDPDERAELRQWRRDLWTEHDESLNEWQWKARRIARTESHGAVSAGQLAAAQIEEQETGVRMWKRWLSVDDTRTRASHRVADGQTVPLDQPFRVGGFLLAHPADSITVAPHEVIGCRCTLLIMDDDELQDEFDDQGGKGDIEPGAVRIGPDDPDAADEAIRAVAEDEGRELPALGKRGEDVGQAIPEPPEDVELTDVRETIPVPDVETATDERLADYLVRTDELQQDELRQQVADELTRRREAEATEVQFGEPEPAPDVLEVDDDGAWLDDPRWSDDGEVDDILSQIDDEIDEPITEADVDDWDTWQTTDDDLPDDAVPADPPEVVEDVVDDTMSPLVVQAQADYDAALAEFSAAADSLDDDRITEALQRMDAAEAYLAEVTQAAEVSPSPKSDQSSGDGADVDVLDDQADDALPEDDDTEFDDDAEWERRMAAEREREQESSWWGDDDGDVEQVELTPEQRRRVELMQQADELAEAEGITYEEALAQVQGLDLEQVHRREFVAQGKREGLISTSFGDMLDELHRRFVFDWELMAEEVTNGQMIKAAYRNSATPDMLWRVNDVTARKYMSDEMAAWFDENGRITKADLERMIEAGEITFDADACLGLWRRWSGRRIGEDYLR